MRRWRADAEVVRRWDLDDGSSATMTAVEVASGADRERIVVRQAVQAWHDAANEYRVLTHLAATDVPAPEPLLLRPRSRRRSRCHPPRALAGVRTALGGRAR